jgi:ankyrin repeat protein
MDECWEMVNASEATQRHCIQLENCCYGYNEMMVLNMVRAGLFGELTHVSFPRGYRARSRNRACWRRFPGGAVCAGQSGSAPLGFSKHQAHNRIMAKLKPRMPSNCSEVMTSARFAAIAVVSLMIGGLVTACARRPANSGGRDADLRRTTRSDDIRIAAALHKWEANVRARDKDGSIAPSSAKAIAGPRDDGRGSAAGSTNAAQALMEAAQSGDAKLVESLLARGADRRILNQALFVAARSEPLGIGLDGKEAKGTDLPYTAVARLLLRKGANIEARDEDGKTPLILAGGHGETAVVKLLLEKGAQIEAADNSGETALIWAACNCPIIDMPDTADSVRLLLESGANVEARDKRGTTPLMLASAWGRTWIVKILLDSGAQMEARDNRGNTALLHAAMGGGYYSTADAGKRLLARGADIDASSNNGATALMLVIGRDEEVEEVQMLLKRGTDVQAKDKKGRTALNLAVGKGRTKIVSLLRAAILKSR